MEQAVAYWVTLAERDLQSASTLLAAGDPANALMLGQQALEKALKAILQQQTAEPPPRTHNLARLSEKAGLVGLMPTTVLDTLLEIDPYIIEARYPANATACAPDQETAASLLARAEEALRWLLARVR